VEKVLFGSTADNTLDFHAYVSGPERQIFALVPEAYCGPTDYEVKYHLGVKEEKSQMAMSAARLDYHALAADSIFVGKEIAVNAADDHKHTVEVVRLLYGSELKAGDKNVLEIVDHIRCLGKVAELRPEPMLYFLRFGRDFPHQKVYYVDTRLPMACEADVLAALKRRDLYPIVWTTERGKKVRGREVTFRGSVEEAIEFLGSERRGAMNLAVRAITRQKDAAREKLAAAIQEEMFRQAAPAWGEFRKLHNLIRLLGRLGGGSSEGPLARLLEKELNYVASQPAVPPASNGPSRAEYRNEADNDAVNHALAWLAVAIDEQALLQRYGNRLRKLRDAAKGHWKAELQLALDAAHVEDNLELVSLPEGKSLHSQARIYQSGGVQSVAFSADGKFLATGGKWGGICIWNTGDWTCARRIDLEGQICNLEFSPEGKFLTATSADGNDLAGQSFEWRTGIAAAQPAGQRIEDTRYRRAASLLTPDGKYRVAARNEYSDEHFMQLRVLRTTGAGQVVAETRSPSVWDDTLALAISPDGGQVAIASGDVRLALYSLPDLKTIKEFQFPFHEGRQDRISQLAYSRDGKWLAAAQEGRHTPRLFRAGSGEEVVPYEGHGDYPVDLRFLPDGRTLRSIGADGTICTWDAATLKMLRRSSLPAGRLAASVRPSDGRYVLCPLARDPGQPLQVIDVETGKALCEVALPVTWSGVGETENKAASARRVHWLKDEEVLCTGYFIDNAGAHDHWWRFNYRTGQVLKDGAIDVETQNALSNGLGELTEDGGHLLAIHGLHKGWGTLRGELIDTTTLRSRTFGENRVERQPNGDFGLVPGGKYFHIGSCIFDRQTLKLVAARDFPRDTLGTIAFSPDGSRYAAAITKMRGVDEWPGIDEWSWYRRYPTLVRVQETLSGRTLLAFSPSAAVWRIAFSADGQRVATANDDGTIEVWDVPSAAVR
jgi:WD40 repeat protein